MECDILVIGAGVLGLSSAYYLKKRDPTRKVTVVERLGSPGQGNSAKSEGAFRNLFTGEANYLLADSTIDWFTHLERGLGYDLKLNRTGYMWLFSEDQHSSAKEAVDAMARHGAEIATYGREEIKVMIPNLVTDFGEDEEAELMGLEPVDVGVFGRKCGSLDADSLVRSYEREFLKLGGEVQYGTEARRLLHRAVTELGIPGEPFVWQESHIAGAETAKGDILAETTVVACGTWAERLLNPVGFDPLMRAKKRQLFAFKDPKLGGLLKVSGLNEEGVLPLTVLPRAGIYLKAELTEGSIWLGCADDLGRKFELEDDPQAEEDYYSNNIYHALVKYLPCFADVRPMNSWAGQYDINSFDETPIVEPGAGIIYVGASSGSGIMKSDALARIVDAVYEEEPEAELYGGRRFRVSDIGVKNRRIEKESLVI